MTSTIAITCGEPAGIGPEIALKAWRALRHEHNLIWIGNPHHFGSDVNWAEVTETDLGASRSNEVLSVIPLACDDTITPGKPNPNHASTVIASIERAVALTKSGQVTAICTSPIHKKALNDGAAFGYPGHTEFLAHLGNVDTFAMMLASPMLRVIPATIHIPLSEVPHQFTPDLLEKTIRLADRSLRGDFGLAQPRLAVAGINPHAGEGGRMGTEEQDWITPLLKRLAQEGLGVSGPWPADTLFHAAARETYDLAICAYHDQALIPLKTLDFSQGVNVTIGLPFVRTSPDHGTAFDIAGKGIADPSSMIAAIRLAAEIGANRAKRN